MLEALSQERTIPELAHDYQVEPEIIDIWIQEFKAKGHKAFEPDDELPVETRSIWGRILLIIIIILLLLTLFWPCGNEKDLEKATPRKPTKGVVGRTNYEILDTEVHPDKAAAKWTILSVTFNVTNLAAKARPLDYTMVQLRDEFGNEFKFNLPETNRHYERKGVESPWGQRIPAGGTKTVTIYFLVHKGGPKKYFFAGRDLDFRAVKYVDYPLGVIDIMAK